MSSVIWSFLRHFHFDNYFLNERSFCNLSLCGTIWASRADALYTFRAAFSNAVYALETLSQDGDGKARGYLCSIKQFDFIIAICAAEHVLPNTVALSNMRSERDDPSVWKEVHEEATQDECPSHKPRVRLAKSCLSPFY